jgi:hypothetical protein
MVTVGILLSPGFRMKSIPMLISLIGLFPALWRTKMGVFYTLEFGDYYYHFDEKMFDVVFDTDLAYWAVPGTLEN